MLYTLSLSLSFACLVVKASASSAEGHSWVKTEIVLFWIATNLKNSPGYCSHPQRFLYTSSVLSYNYQYYHYLIIIITGIHLALQIVADVREKEVPTRKTLELRCVRDNTAISAHQPQILVVVTPSLIIHNH